MDDVILLESKELQQKMPEDKPTPPKLALSIVIPILNEAQNIPLIYQRIIEVMATTGKAYEDSYEVIFIDDGSTDTSFELCSKISDNDHRIKAVQFRRNFGKTSPAAQPPAGSGKPGNSWVRAGCCTG